MGTHHMGRLAMLVSAVMLALGLAAAPVAAGGGQERWVDNDGMAGPAHGCAGTAAAFDSVQDAIDASGANDVVWICPGTYRENLRVTAQPGLQLRSVKRWKAVLMPTPAVTSAAATATVEPSGTLTPVLYIESNRVLARWLTIKIPATGNCDYAMHGVVVQGAGQVQIRGNRITGGAGAPDQCGMGTGIYFEGAATGQASYNIIQKFVNSGITAYLGPSVLLYRNSIRMFTPGCVTAVACAAAGRPAGSTTAVAPALGPSQVGIRANNAAVRIRGNVVREDPNFVSSSFSYGIGIDVFNSSAVNHVVINGNTVVGAVDGISVFQASDGTITRNHISGGSGRGIALLSASNWTVDHNRVTGRGGSGIVLDNGTSLNDVDSNDFSGNVDTDCVDATGNVAVAGPVDPIDNTWTNDVGDESSPAGICLPSVGG
ncbi:MAG: hypothetical protein QOH61_401 [Chloroflexota bacterium]|nr:hypothetical protein [Chloroflexota bacterium]